MIPGTPARLVVLSSSAAAVYVCLYTYYTADPSSSLKLVKSRRRRPHSQGRVNLIGCCGELVCSLWPGEQRSVILMSVLLTGLYQVSINRKKLMERVCHDSLGFNVLSPAITTTVSHTHKHSHRCTFAHGHTAPGVTPRYKHTSACLTTSGIVEFWSIVEASYELEAFVQECSLRKFYTLSFYKTDILVQ